MITQRPLSFIETYKSFIETYKFFRDLQVSVQWSTGSFSVVCSKLGTGLIQRSLHSLETLEPEVSPSLCLGYYSLGPSCL